MTPEVMNFTIEHSDTLLKISQKNEELRIENIMHAYTTAYDAFKEKHPQADHNAADDFAQFITQCYVGVSICNVSS